MHISVSILACNLLRLEKELDSVRNADSIHFDAMDGHYVDSISFGSHLCGKIHDYIKLPIHAHLMISNPDRRVCDYIDACADSIIVHPETCFNINVIHDTVKRNGCKFACAIYSKCDMDIAEKMLSIFDFFVFMTVKPGKSFQKISYDRLTLLKEFSSRIYKSCKEKKEIFVDGGVSAENARQCIDSGANSLISGGYIFKSFNPNLAIRSLRESVCF